MEIVTWFGRIDQKTGQSRPLVGNAQEALAGSLTECLDRQPDLRSLAKDLGFAATSAEYNARLREMAIAAVKDKLLNLVDAEKDLLQAVEALDDLNVAINLLDERLYEWSRLRRQEIVHGKDLAQALSCDEVSGELARAVLGLRQSRSAMEKDVARSTKILAPNLSCLAGSVLAARLISRSGGLKRLAEMPSSGIQVMGAEKSLFKHLHGRAPSPKHGLIYRHPSIIGMPKRLRGKAARALAGKLAIAARLDFYGAGLSSELKSSLDLRIGHIKDRIKPRPRI